MNSISPPNMEKIFILREKLRNFQKISNENRKTVKYEIEIIEIII